MLQLESLIFFSYSSYETFSSKITTIDCNSTQKLNTIEQAAPPRADPPLNKHTHTHTHRGGLQTPDIQLWLWLASRTKPPGMTHPVWFNATVNRASGGDAHARMWSVIDIHGYISLWNTSFPWREHLRGSEHLSIRPDKKKTRKRSPAWIIHISLEDDWRWFSSRSENQNESGLNPRPVQMYTEGTLLLSSDSFKPPPLRLDFWSKYDLSQILVLLLFYLI